MKSEFLTEVEEAYNAASRVEPDAIEEFLSHNYSDRPDILLEVRSLLQHQTDAANFERSIASMVASTAAEMLDDTQTLIGSVIGGRYVIRSCIGAGAMAEVYLADHVALKTPFALKRPLPALRSDPDYRSRFLEEARRAVLLKHDNVARVHDVINEGPDIFVVMEHVEGETLRARMKKMNRPFTVSEFLPIAMQCASALAAAHEKRIVHLDVKPENIMITPAGQIKICDFGVARRLSSDSSNDTTETSHPQWTLAGTPAYMAPEVILSHNFDERADLFSLGTVFYEMLSGRNPFVADTLVATTARVVSDNPPPISSINVNLNRQFDRIISRLLAKEPENRYKTVNELVRDLEAVHRSNRRLLDFTRNIREEFAESRWLKLSAAIVLIGLFASPVFWSYRSKFLGSVPDNGVAGPSVVFITDIENQTGDSFFDSTVRELLNLGLMQSAQFYVVSDDRIGTLLRQTEKSTNGKLNLKTALQIASLEPSSRVLNVKVIQARSGYEILSDVFAGSTGRRTASERELVSAKKNLPAAISTLSERLRSELGESRLSVQQNHQSVELATSSSPVAVERFTQGLELERKGKQEDARILLASATEIDPDFALAFAHLANVQASSDFSADALRSITRAFELRDRVTEREKYFIAGYYHQLRTEYDKAIDSYKTAVALYPLDANAYRLLASAHATVYDIPNALIAVNKGLDLQPDDTLLRGFQVEFLADVNKLDEAIRASEANDRLLPEQSYPHWNQGLLWLTMGDTARAREAFQLLAQREPSFENVARFFLAQISIYDGDFAAAISQMETDLASRMDKEREWFIGARRYSLARLFLLLEKRPQALQQIMLLEKAQTMPSKLYNLRDAGRLYAEMHEVRLAEDVIVGIESLMNDYPGNFGRAAILQIRGEVDASLGHAARARDELEQARRLWDDPGMVWSLARYWENQADYAKAAGFYSELLQRKALTVSRDFPGLWVLANLHLARCAKALGNNTDAARYYEAFLSRWGTEKHLPFIRDVERERDKVVQ